MNFKNINEFVINKFSEGTTPLTLITSLNTSDTIDNVNAALVLADRGNQTIPLSKLIGKRLNRSVYVQSDSDGTYASVAILCYQDNPKPKKHHGKNWENLESYIENNLIPVNPVRLLTSSSCHDTIGGKNCVKVLAATEKLSEIITAVLQRRGLEHSIHILSESNKDNSAVSIVAYHHSDDPYPHGKLMF